MASRNDNTSAGGEFSAKISFDDLAKEIGRVEDVADRVRLAGHGLASPLLSAYAGQRQREVVRTAKRKGADHPEVARRKANLERGGARLDLVVEERHRARVTRPAPPGDAEATVWGRVVDNGAPVADVTVSAIADGKRLDYRCTDAVGAFDMAVPCDTPFGLSVQSKDGTEVFRDSETTSLEEGQQQYREIDLTRGADRPCPEPPDVPADGPADEPPKDPTKEVPVEPSAETGDTANETPGNTVEEPPDPSTVAMPDVVGLPLDGAVSVLAEFGIDNVEVEGVPTKEHDVDRVVRQHPKAGEPVAPDDVATLVHGVSRSKADEHEQFGHILVMAEERLRENGTIPSEAPDGALREMIGRAGVDDVAGLNDMLAVDRRELRAALDLGTLVKTDRTIAALKWARRKVEG